jgi:hypothetical protein
MKRRRGYQEMNSIINTPHPEPKLHMKDNHSPVAIGTAQIVCDSDPYPRYLPGEYIARVISPRKYKHQLLGAWKCELKLQLMDGGDFGTVYAFFHLGRGTKPHAGRNSNYHRVWVMANGSPPRKRQVTSERVFVGQIFKVLVGDVSKTYSGRERGEAGTYSVCELVSLLENPSPQNQTNQVRHTGKR